MQNKKNLRLEKAGSSDRLYALLIDYAVMTLFPWIIIMAFISYSELDSILLDRLYWTFFILFFFKDIFSRSFGKKIIGLKIVEKDDYSRTVKPYITVIRNFFLLFGGLEFLVILFAKGRRIADMVTNSIVVKEYEDVHIPIQEETLIEPEIIMILYLSSYEYEIFEIPRKILNFRKEKIGNRNTLIVEIDKPIIGQEYGFGGTDIHTLYLINRFDEHAFDKLDSFPIDVHVFIPKSPNNFMPTSLLDMQNIAWACLYNNEEDAINHKI